MVLNFQDDSYIDMDKIIVMRWLPTHEVGVVIFDGERITVEKEAYDVIKEAFTRLHNTHLYDKELKKIRGK